MDGSELREHPDHAGWIEVAALHDMGFNRLIMGDRRVRVEGPAIARVRTEVDERHTNPRGALHGGMIMSFADYGMFIGVSAIRGDVNLQAVTVDLSMQFVGAGAPDQTLDCVVEVVRETGKMIFVRGFVEQGESRIAAYSGLLRKITPR